MECLQLLSGSDYATQDRYDFMKAQIVFWLMGATGGHAKNFSLFLNSGGRFPMAPFYDIISTQPNFDNNEMRRQDYKLAMAVGQKRHSAIFRIEQRHFEQSAQAAGMAIRIALEIQEELIESIESALVRTIQAMPDDFPYTISDSIAAAMRKRLHLN